MFKLNFNREVKQRRRRRRRERSVCADVAMISTHPTCTKTANFPGIKLARAAFELRKRLKNSPSCAHVLHRTLNLVISRFCRGRQRNVQKHKTHVQSDCIYSLYNCFATLSLPSPSSLYFERSLLKRIVNNYPY